MVRPCRTLAVAGLLAASAVEAITVDWTSQSSVKSAASSVAYGMMKYYTGNNTGDTPGNLPDPYYWWEAGAMFGSLIDYWYYTGDTTYNNVTTQAILHQTGDNNDFMPTNQTKSLGNDDQGFWALTAMTAAELKYPDPPSTSPQWLALAQAVFNEQAQRWDTLTCGGGLRWQIFAFNNGYNYKNTISNGCLFNIGARLARYTGNTTYSDWAIKVWDWESRVGLISSKYEVFDGSDSLLNCTELDRNQWSYNAGIYMHGAANMYNITTGTTQAMWKERINGVLNATISAFFRDNIMYERQCEDSATCDNDQRTFKAYLSRWMAATTKLAPFTADTINVYLSASAAAAAAQCSGTVCGFKWTTNGVNDGSVGVGEQMCALEIIQSRLISYVSGPVTNSTGGTSTGNSNAGGGSTDGTITSAIAVTQAGRIGAGILTAIWCAGVVGGCYFMMS